MTEGGGVGFVIIRSFFFGGGCSVRVVIFDWFGDW